MAHREAFARKPYQGQAPEEAKYIFMGLAANYAEEVGQARVHWHHHLSVYGKFEAPKREKLRAVRRLLGPPIP